MKRVTVQNDWPDNWKYSYKFDLEEVYGVVSNQGYAYAYKARSDIAIRLLQEVLPFGATVLDIAAAQGNFTLILAEMGYAVTWNDLREDLSTYVQLKHERGDIQFVPGNVFELQFTDLFDAVLITEVIEHVAHPDAFLEKIASFVKPGGYIIMTTPNGGYFRNPLPRFSDYLNPSDFEAIQFKPDSDGHIFLLYRDEIEMLANKTGLVIDKIALFTNPLTAGHVKLHYLLRLLPRAVVDVVEKTTQKLPLRVRDTLMTHLAARFRKL